MKHEFVAQWPILDEDITWPQAIEEADADLVRLIEEHGVVLLSDPVWRRRHHAGVTFVEMTAEARKVAKSCPR